MFKIHWTNAESHSERENYLSYPHLSSVIIFFKIQQNDLAYAGENVMQILIFSQQYKLEYGLLLQ